MRTRRSQSSSDPVSESCSASAKGGSASGGKATQDKGHRTVLLHEAVDALDIKRSDIVVDATLGGAGHALAIAQKLGKKGLLIGFDLDADAIGRAEEALANSAPRTILIQANFRDMQKELRASSIEKVDKALFDLGWSGYQLDAGRGFSFQKNEPLLMTYSKKPGMLTAATIVNEWAESSIADVIFGWGQERYSRRIAKRIIEQRAKKPFATALELAETIREAVPAPYRRGRLHPATKTFQALRIAVNDELGALKDGLLSVRDMLAQKGRIAVITFHSIEDGLVKRMFADWERQGMGRRITKKPIVPSMEELRENPRARSAKLRVFENTLEKVAFRVALQRTVRDTILRDRTARHDFAKSHEKTFRKNKSV